LLYVLLRMPLSLKDRLPRGKIELAITNWFKEKTSLQSIYITEPVYTEDMSDRIDAVLFIGGFDPSEMLSGLEQKVRVLRDQAVKRGLMSEDWQVITKTEEPKKTKMTNLELPKDMEEPKKIDEAQTLEEVKSFDNVVSSVEPKITESPTTVDEPKNVVETKPAVKPKRVRRIKKAETEKNLDEIKIDAEKERKTPTA
jgi:glycine cleavage system H lipoate-binding protein